MFGDIIDDLFRIKPGTGLSLARHDTGWAQTEEMRRLGKADARKIAEDMLDQSIKDLAQAQELLYATDRYALLIVLQAMDAAGKDSTIKHVMSGINPQGCEVYSFKRPSLEEVDHNFLWRYMRRLPERGRIGIFNRSYYEDVLVVRVHPEILAAQRLPIEEVDEHFWQHRYDDINAFEHHLARNGTVILKFFLHLSREEQKQRFLERLKNPEKNWKFSQADLVERGYWDDYMQAYEKAISATSTAWAPWYVVPADNKWVTRAVVAEVIASAIQALNLEHPKPDAAQRELLERARQALEQEP